MVPAGDLPTPEQAAHRAGRAGAVGEQALGTGPFRLPPAPEHLHRPPDTDPLRLPAGALHRPGNRDKRGPLRPRSISTKSGARPLAALLRQACP
jgi:hypothetical protein